MDGEIDNFPKFIDPCLALQGAQELARLAEHSQVKVIVIVGDTDLPGGSQPHPDGEVGHALAPDLAEVVALVVEHLDTVGAVVRDEDLHRVVDDHAVGELEKPELIIEDSNRGMRVRLPGAAEFV